LTAYCDGRDSASRQRLGVEFERSDYGQQAIAARLVAPQSHQNVARQWFASPDVLALLPFDQPETDRSFALVWSTADARATQLMSMDVPDFEQSLFDATGGAVGRLRLAESEPGTGRAAWPLALGRVSRWCGPGWALLGDAAHVVHPLAGQGLNLGLADVRSLSRVIHGRESWRPIGDERLLNRYMRERLAPTWAMGTMTDTLQRLFASQAAPARELRNHGLSLVNRLSPLKRWLTARALDA
jgi:ubiquinone biosynthesis UbiH/UbiF/VisC/COQ6 family hydroxylase